MKEPSETASSRAGGTLSSFVVIPIKARNPGRARRRRRADQQYARQAAWFEARADGPGHYSRRCAYCGCSFYGARSTATYCRPSCRVQAHKRRTAKRTAHCPGLWQDLPDARVATRVLRGRLSGGVLAVREGEEKRYRVTLSSSSPQA